ncbi:type VII secretion protein EccB [Dactylosporangium sp. AC04546]|uniref:type VII secretion protein EccB n=1 Tax=Dactylosporangium sp. AC04546 TaxID=2862460 RepID=UPI001EDD78FB|nr:type VII secretion protein EccB [Dactylosporangium sp. AC04546]WVK86658.1 type VII secretion protein EccB [Dactylosporangium sp. AC04546]
MQTRRDQVQAHSFVMSRLVSAMLRAEPDSPHTPNRRFVIGWVCGLVLGALAVAACGVYGYIVPGGNTKWKTPGTLIVEKETGSRYVYLDGVLRPVANYTSARLLLGGEPTVVQVSGNSLADVPHGLPVGIEAAPDHLPKVDSLDGTKWLVCSTTRTDSAGAVKTHVTLWVGATAKGETLEDGRGLLVRSPAGEVYLAWHNRRLRISSAAQLSVLGYASAVQQPVGWAWLDVVPAGPDLAAPDTPGRGRPGPVIGGTASKVGQLFKLTEAVAGQPDGQHYLVRTDGLSPVTATGAALLLVDPRTAQAYPGGQVRALPLTPAALAGAPMSVDQTVNPLHPAAPPALAQPAPGTAPCLQVTVDAKEGPTARIALGEPPAVPETPAVVAVREPRLADRVVVQPGAGLLIRDQPAPGVADGTLHLLVDTGVRYPLAGTSVAEVLGYGAATPVPVPAALLDLIPVGPSLDPETAKATIPVTTSNAPG